MRYLPSIVVIVVLIIAWVFADRTQTLVLEKGKHDAADATLRDVQTQIDNNISRTVRGSRRLAALIDPSFNIDQEGFENLIKNTDTGPAKTVRAEFAPDFITKLVYPMDGNEAYIGKSPLRTAPDNLSQLQGEVARGFPTLSSVKVLENGIGEIHVRTELRAVDGSQVISTGLLHLVKQFELSVVDPTEKFLAGELDFIFQVHEASAPPPVLPAEWQSKGNMEPISYTMRYPPGDILLFARPVDGWGLSVSEAADHRLRLAGLGLLLLLPVLLANWFVISRDATRERLAATVEQMSGLLKNLPGAAFTYTIPAGCDGPGPDDRVSFLNPEACKKIWEVDAELAEANPKVIWDLIANEQAAGELSDALVNTKSSMQPFDNVWPIETPSGKRKWLRCKAIPARNEDGSVYWSTLIFDNTESVERSSELEKQRELAFHAQKNETIGQLTGGVAHDFNNLLAVILVNLELLQTNPDHPERDIILEESINSSLRGADLTSNMLAFAMKSRLTPEVLHLNELIHEVRNWIKRTLPATITVKMNTTDNLWPVSADQTSTESALLNLIVNARDAMSTGGVLTIETANVTINESDNSDKISELSAGRYVVLSVSDDGSGINDDHLQNIFEPFYTTKETGKGSGLGLSMITGFMQQSGGAVTVETEKGKGTTFKLYFAAVDNVETVPVDVKKVSTSSRVDCRILLAEDDLAVGESLRRTLEEEGFKVVQAKSGDDALSVFNSDTAFDVLLTDLVMPGKVQGRELAVTLQKKCPTLAVIYISGYSVEASQLSFESGAEHISLAKPVKRRELIGAIESVLSFKHKQWQNSDKHSEETTEIQT